MWHHVEQDPTMVSSVKQELSFPEQLPHPKGIDVFKTFSSSITLYSPLLLPPKATGCALRPPWLPLGSNWWWWWWSGWACSAEAAWGGWVYWGYLVPVCECARPLTASAVWECLPSISSSGEDGVGGTSSAKTGKHVRFRPTNAPWGFPDWISGLVWWKK